jgi:hypothetical protein
MSAEARHLFRLQLWSDRMASGFYRYPDDHTARDWHVARGRVRGWAAYIIGVGV